MITKSGLMVGLGEEREEIQQVMDDLRCADVDFLTIGQYLQPTRKHAAVARYVPPEEFAGLERIARAKGFVLVSASPLTRSSYHAGEDFARLQAARAARARCSPTGFRSYGARTDAKLYASATHRQNELVTVARVNCSTESRAALGRRGLSVPLLTKTARLELQRMRADELRQRGS